MRTSFLSNLRNIGSPFSKWDNIWDFLMTALGFEMSSSSSWNKCSLKDLQLHCLISIDIILKNQPKLLFWNNSCKEPHVRLKIVYIFPSKCISIPFHHCTLKMRTIVSNEGWKLEDFLLNCNPTFKLNSVHYRRWKFNNYKII